MANINVTIRMNKDLKEEADNLFHELGMSFTTAVTIFAQQAVREKRIPFEISLNQRPAVGAMNTELHKQLIQECGGLEGILNEGFWIGY